MSNRVTVAFARMETQINDRIAKGLTTTEKVADTCKVLDMDILEYVKFQEIKSLAVATGKLTLDEGQCVYACLGQSVETFNRQPVHVKSVLTNLFQELLTARIAEAKTKQRKRFPRRSNGERVGT